MVKSSYYNLGIISQTIMTVATKRLTIEEYHHLIDLGAFKETDRLELIKGQLI
jgi:hypothetical protein